MKNLVATVSILLAIVGLFGASSSTVQAGEEERRAFLDPDDRAQKFQAADRIYPARRVVASESVLALPQARLPDDFVIEYEFDGKLRSVDEFNERTNSNALIVLKNGKVVLEKYRNGSAAETRFISFSTGKSFTSTMVGMAIEDGFIDSVDDPLTKYLPALTGSAYDGVSIRQALQMSSGVEWAETSYDLEDMTIALSLHWEQAMVQQRYRFVEAANTLPRAHAPGSKYNYNTLETTVLGWLVENATKKRFAQYFEERLWQPAGMEFDAAWIIDGPQAIGREMTGGGLASTLRDYARFGLLMAGGGRINGKQLVSSEWVSEATTARGEQVAYGKLYPGYPLGYGYQWWLFPGGHFEAQGVFGQLIYVAPEEGVVIVKLSYWPEAWVEEMEMESYAFFAAVIDAVSEIN